MPAAVVKEVLRRAAICADLILPALGFNVGCVAGVVPQNDAGNNSATTTSKKKNLFFRALPLVGLISPRQGIVEI